MNISEQLTRTKMLIGTEALTKLANSKVIVFGVGGVGGYVVEALVRSGIGNIAIVDNDKVNISNLNRQIIALHSTIGKYKVDVLKDRILDINSDINVETYKLFFNEETKNEIDFKKYDYIVDAIDYVRGKVILAECAKAFNVNIISSMGTGNKMNPQDLIVSDLSKTHTCPLARTMRTELKKIGIRHLKVVFSKEPPIKHDNQKVPASNSFVPSTAGLLIASEVIKDIINN